MPDAPSDLSRTRTSIVKLKVTLQVQGKKNTSCSRWHYIPSYLLSMVSETASRILHAVPVVTSSGEEFVIIMPEATVEVAAGRAQELRKGFKLSNLDYESLLPVGEITISLGVSAFPRNGLTVEAIFKAADDALYEAKDSGRDRVCVAKVRENNPAVNSSSSI